MRHWKPEDILEVECPWCESEIEFWKDEPVRVCRGCGREVRNPKLDLSCARWCRFAEECVGDVANAPLLQVSLHHQLIVEMRDASGQDAETIQRAADVLDHAERILETEGGDPLIVRAAALLYGVERLAPAILEKLGVASPEREQICRIVDPRRGAGESDSPESRIVRDAVRLADSPRETVDLEQGELRAWIEKAFRTPGGRELAAQRLLSGL